MEDQEIIDKTKDYVKKKLQGEGSGHDWWHVYRVWNNAKNIAKSESVDVYTVELAALLHDIADFKFHKGDDTVGPKVAKEWLTGLNVNEEMIAHVCSIIQDVSFKGANVSSPMKSKEGMVVQDADRLDALGAVGIARAFAYGGHKGREMYNPDIKPVMHDSFENYKKNQSTTINHFYEKLLLLKDLMNTETGKRIAEKRHKVIVDFLDKFKNEWDGKD